MIKVMNGKVKFVGDGAEIISELELIAMALREEGFSKKDIVSAVKAGYKLNRDAFKLNDRIFLDGKIHSIKETKEKIVELLREKLSSDYAVDGDSTHGLTSEDIEKFIEKFLEVLGK